MNVYYSRIEADPLDCSKEETWNRLYPLLRSIARYTLRTSCVSIILAIGWQ